MCDQQRIRPACAYAQSDQSLCVSLEFFMTVKQLTEHHLESSIKGDCTDSSESTLVKMPQCWKSHVGSTLCVQLPYSFIPFCLKLCMYLCHDLKNIRIYHEYEGRLEKSVPRIAFWHLEVCRVTTNCDPEGRIFLSYPHLLSCSALFLFIYLYNYLFIYLFIYLFKK